MTPDQIDAGAQELFMNVMRPRQFARLRLTWDDITEESRSEYRRLFTSAVSAAQAAAEHDGTDAA